MSKKVVFATDYSPGSEAVLRVAATLARQEGATLLIAHVSMEEPYPVGESCHKEPRPNPAELKRLESIVPPVADVPCEHRLLYGEPGSVDVTRPAEVLIKFAQQEQADMIVVGTHGRTGLSHALMGSVAETLVRRAPCVVVTVKLADNAT
ncbi:MAG: universal stress protein [Planctomycetales bacterium]|nr:universal stress protein [Planctomycetales bacterium]